MDFSHALDLVGGANLVVMDGVESGFNVNYIDPNNYGKITNDK